MGGVGAAPCPSAYSKAAILRRKIRERHDRAVTLVANRYGEITGTSACDLRRSVLRLANRRGDADALPIDDDLVDYAFANMYLQTAVPHHSRACL